MFLLQNLTSMEVRWVLIADLHAVLHTTLHAALYSRDRERELRLLEVLE